MGQKPPRGPLMHLEILEDRCNPSSPSLLTTVTLPGANIALPAGAGGFTQPSSLIYDLDGDGSQEIITPGGDGNVYAYHYNTANGQVVQSAAFLTGQPNSWIQATPVLVNLSSGLAIFFGNSNGSVFAFDAHSHALLPGWPQTVATPLSINSVAGQNKILGALAVGDLDGDGSPEIVVTSYNQEVTAFHANGSVMWRFNNDDTLVGGAAIGDINGDGKPEVVIGADSSPGLNYNQGGHVIALSSDGRREWVHDVDQVIWSSPVLVDLLGDGRLKVVVGTGTFYRPGTPPTLTTYPGNEVVALDGSGNLVPGWPYITGPNTSNFQVYSSPAVADLNNDGSLEIVVGDGSGRIHAIKANGQALWVSQGFGNQILYSSAIIADANGDGKPDVLMSGLGNVRAFDGATGSQFFSFQDNLFHNDTGAVGHFKGDASYQAAFVGQLDASNGPGKLDIFDLGTSSLSPPWAELRGAAIGSPVLRSDVFCSQLIAALYLDALGRPAAQAEINLWLPTFRSAQTLESAAQNIVGSLEGRSRVVNDFYFRFLGRNADQGGLNYYTSVIGGGATYAQVELFLASSQECYNHSGGTNQSYVNLLYQQMLGRPLAAGDNYWTGVLNQNQLSRYQVAQSILNSTEGLNRFINQIYAKYAPGGLTSPAADSQVALRIELRRGRREEQIIDDLLASRGDYARVQFEASVIRGFYRDTLGRLGSAGEVAGWLQTIENNNSLNSVAYSFINSHEHNQLVVTGFFQTYLHRTPTPLSIAGLVAQLDQGQSRESLIATLLGTDEYWNLHGGNASNFIVAVYQDLLGFPAPSGTIAQYQSDPNVRFDVPKLILVDFPQGFYIHSVSNLYLTYLRRFTGTPVDQSRLIQGQITEGLNYVNVLINHQAALKDVEVALLTSHEYLYLIAWDKGFWLGQRWLS